MRRRGAAAAGRRHPRAAGVGSCHLAGVGTSPAGAGSSPAGVGSSLAGVGSCHPVADSYRPVAVGSCHPAADNRREKGRHPAEGNHQEEGSHHPGAVAVDSFRGAAEEGWSWSALLRFVFSRWQLTRITHRTSR